MTDASVPELIEQLLNQRANSKAERLMEKAAKVLKFTQLQINDLEEDIYALHNPHSGEECNCNICNNQRGNKK